jgi:hypothetical protein
MREANIDKLNVKSIKNFTRIILKSPEVSEDYIRNLIQDDRITLINISGNLYLIEAKNIPFEEFQYLDEHITEILDNIKFAQIEFYDKPENRDSIYFSNEITDQISKFIVEVNKKGVQDVDKVTLLLQNILLDIYEHPEVEASFLDRKAIDYLAKASVSQIVEEAKINITEALKEILINIRKLILVWIYDQCNVSIINYETDRKEVSQIQENDLIKIENKIFQKISLPQRYSARLDILYNAESNSIITSNFGKDKIKQVLPFVYLTIFDQILFHIRLETHEIQKRALRNVERSIIQDLKQMSSFDDVSIEDLEVELSQMTMASDFFSKLLNNQVNHLRSENRKIKIYYKRDYMRALSNQLMNGSISKELFNITAMRSLDELEITTEELQQISYDFSNLSSQVKESINGLIKAKKENNPSIFNKIKKEFNSFLSDVLAKYGAEMTKR